MQKNTNGKASGPRNDDTLVVIACPVETRRKHWGHALRGKYRTVEIAEKVTLEHTLSRLQPSVLLLDLSSKRFVDGRSLWHMQRLSPPTRIVVLSRDPDEETELAYLLAGARACCAVGITGAVLRRAVAAVRDGEIWARRRVWGMMHDQFQSFLQGPLTDLPEGDESARLLGLLTPRQREIVRLVGGGGSNKEIAGRLRVSEKTVKAHLTLAFQKLKVSDRLRLALFVNGHGDPPYVSLPLTQLTRDPQRLSFWTFRNR